MKEADAFVFPSASAVRSVFVVFRSEHSSLLLLSHCSLSVSFPQNCSFVTGKDVCAIATLKTYLQTAIEKGCSDEFINDMVLVLREFERFQNEEPQKVKIPD